MFDRVRTVWVPVPVTWYLSNMPSYLKAIVLFLIFEVPHFFLGVGVEVTSKELNGSRNTYRRHVQALLL